MTIQTVQPTYFETPHPDPLAGTLLDAATVIEGVDFLEPTGLMETFNCLAVDSKATWPCPPNSLAAPTATGPSTATTGGTLPAGTYRAVVTATNSRGETVASNEVSQVTTGATSTVTWNWSAVAGATGYRVYVTAVGGATGTEVFLGSSASSPLIQTAPVTAGGARPPTSNSATVPVSKNFTGPNWQDGFRFAVYGGLTCKAPGFNLDQGRGEIGRVFAARETVAVARAFMQTRFIAGTGWTAPTDLTPAGGAVDPTVGMALLEGDAAAKYAGVPTIHSPRTVTTLLARNGAVLREGQRFYSVQGSIIASDGGYQSPSNGPGNTAPAAGELWMFGSGQVVVARSELIVVGDIDRATNDQYVLCERAYVGACDCYTAAVRVKVA